MTDAMAAYLTAKSAWDAYYPTMEAARVAYRAMRIGAAEFIAACKINDALSAAFDVAFAAVQDEPEEIEAAIADNAQDDLFA